MQFLITIRYVKVAIIWDHFANAHINAFSELLIKLRSVGHQSFAKSAKYKEAYTVSACVCFCTIYISWLGARRREPSSHLTLSSHITRRSIVSQSFRSRAANIIYVYGRGGEDSMSSELYSRNQPDQSRGKHTRRLWWGDRKQPHRWPQNKNALLIWVRRKSFSRVFRVNNDLSDQQSDRIEPQQKP